MRLYVNSGKLVLAAMRLRRVGIDGRGYAAAAAQISRDVTPPAPAAQAKSRLEPAAALLGRCVAEKS
jgi:hypothetical protein